MKIIIAGGTGLIGKALAEDLVQRGHQVWVLSRHALQEVLPEQARLPGIHAVAWDAKTAQGWENLAAEADAIINLTGANIGERPWTNERKRLIRDSRMNAGQAIVSALQEAGHRPGILLQIAGVGYYGVHGDEPLDENAGAGGDYLARVAADWEGSTQAVEELGVRRVVMRTGVVLASKGGVLEPFILQNKLFAAGPLGSGRQWISWIHIADLVRAFNFFLENQQARGVYNVTSPEPVTNAAFGRMVAQVMHRPFWAPAPAFALRAVLGEMSTLVLDGQRVLPERLLEMGFQFEFGELRKALEDLLGKR